MKLRKEVRGVQLYSLFLLFINTMKSSEILMSSLGFFLILIFIFNSGFPRVTPDSLQLSFQPMTGQYFCTNILSQIDFRSLLSDLNVGREVHSTVQAIFKSSLAFIFYLAFCASYAHVYSLRVGQQYIKSLGSLWYPLCMCSVVARNILVPTTTTTSGFWPASGQDYHFH